MGRFVHAARQSPQGELQACTQHRIAHTLSKRNLTINVSFQNVIKVLAMVACGLAACGMVWYGSPMHQDGFPMVIVRTVFTLHKYLRNVLSVILIVMKLQGMATSE